VDYKENKVQERNVTIAILGAAGAAGKAVAAALQQRNIPFRAVGRNKARLEEAFKHYPGAELVDADLMTVEGVRKAVRGMSTLIHAAGVLYSDFERLPPMMRASIDGAVAEGVKRIVLITNVYSYGRPRTSPVKEDHPREPHTKKGQLRKQQEDLLMEAHAQGKLQAQIVRFPDFYGPDAEYSFSIELFRAAVAGKPANLLGNIDLPHEFIYTPDIGQVLAELATRDDVWGEVWNCGGAGTITQRQLVTRAFEAAGRKPKFRVAGTGLVRVMGLFIPLMRELVEMMYQWQETPLVLDDSKLRAKLGSVKKTSYEDGIRLTVDALKSRAAK
jgi:nucleoside-diphosphate-sugar epimerase